MPFELAPLPYAKDALEPLVSAATLEFHHGKHHATYVATLNKLIEGTPLADMPLEKIIHITAKDPEKTNIFNNAGQVWNHNFFWHSLSPTPSTPTTDLQAQIDESFGGLNKFKEEFKTMGTSQFGSGWVWLVLDKGELKITKTANGENPLLKGQTSLLCCDVWEHAYYLDYQNRRPDFLDAFVDHLINWDFAASNITKAADAA